jgi:hypothetical protein
MTEYYDMLLEGLASKIRKNKRKKEETFTLEKRSKIIFIQYSEILYTENDNESNYSYKNVRVNK